jgi:hypothetical protein
VSASVLYLGWNCTAAVSITQLGTVTVTDLEMGRETSVTLHGGDAINNQIDPEQSSVVNVLQSSGGTGLALK